MEKIVERIKKIIQDIVLPELEVIKGENRDIKTILELTNKRLDDINAHIVDQSRRIDETNKRIDEVNRSGSPQISGKIMLNLHVQPKPEDGNYQIHDSHMLGEEYSELLY